MSALLVFADDRPDAPPRVLRDGRAIADALAPIGVRFERWEASRRLPDGASPQDVLKAYAAQVERLKTERGYRTADVVRVTRGHPDAAAMRQKFLAEHRHAEDEVRFFVEGRGTFYFHVDGQVYALLGEKDDLIGVPAGTRHWFDMGSDPAFCAVRLFVSPDGWVAAFTGDAIATRFLTHDDVVARATGTA